jgi:LuxR family transcriptional activator of conjugal transfer of Ti plasmids
LDREFRAFIDMVETAHDEKMIKYAIKTFATALGFERFAYLQAEGDELRTVHSYPLPWENVYLTNQYATIDPVVTEAKRRMEVFSWSADTWPSRGSSLLRRFRDQAIDHGIRSGVTIPVHGSFDSKILLTFASSSAQADASIWSDPAKAVQAALAVHYRLKIIAAGIVLAPKRMFSPKEAVCVMWAAKGKFGHEIADITGISPRTVQHYLDSARQKLGAVNIQHLVALAKDRGLI